MKPILFPLLFAVLVGMTACKDDSKTELSSSKTTTEAGWPRTIETVKGPIEIIHPPKRIVSTSVTLTGTLLTIHAPLIASSATRHMTNVTDDLGFFTQWSKIAQERNVKPLYQGEVNVEAVLSLSPDLIIVSATGGDSALKAYEQLSQIAPTLVVNYDDKSWEDLAFLLGKATGHEADAKTAVTAFQTELNAVKSRIQLPAEPVSAMVYYEDNSGANLWTKDSAQGRLLTKLGFQLAEFPASLAGQSTALGRKDIIPVSGERFAESLTGKSLMLFSADATTAEKVKHNSFLAKHPAIQADRVYPLGIDTFRLDYYSATNLLHRIDQLFSGSPSKSARGGEGS